MMKDDAAWAGMEIVDLTAGAHVPPPDELRLRPHVGVWSPAQQGSASPGRGGLDGWAGLSMILAPADEFDPAQHDPAAARMVVPVPDVGVALRLLEGAAQSHPAAMTVLHHVLVTGEGQSTDVAFALESLAYSTLMGGPEYASWLSTRPHAPVDPEPSADHVDVSASADGSTLQITLDRPERKNAFGRVMRAELLDALSVLDHAPDMRAEIRGTGSVFCSGGDLSEFGAAPDVAAAHLIRSVHHVGRVVVRHRDRITVHAHGACIGAGVELPALASRFVAASGTWFCLPEVGMGLIPGAGGTVSVARRIGRWRAAYMAMTGVRIDAGTAREWGLIDDIADL